ncbi:MAG: bifunctional UDP-N-acetylmuramoyl-tripeptide:D-alanyl-D-alanine ligase/alanine racemase [Bacteroides sp.]
MLNYSFQELQWAFPCRVQGVECAPIREVAVDSRMVTEGARLLFFALVGENHDAHDYIESLYRVQGVRCFVISTYRPAYRLLTEATFFCVEDTRRALQQLASYHRQRFQIPVVGITGSNGKTVVKEWLSQVLAAKWRINHSPKSYNSQIGVPLSVLGLAPKDEIGVYEAGISQMDEMRFLEEIIRPTLGIFTNLGHAHQAGFPDIETKGHEKMLLFARAKQLVVCRDQETVYALALQLQREHGVELITWSVTGREADWQVTLSAENSRGGLPFSLCLRKEPAHEYRGVFPANDAATVENALHTLVASVVLGMPIAVALKLVEGLRSVSMRLERREGVNGHALINDSYSCDLESLEVALGFLCQQADTEKKGLILSDIDQSGIAPQELYMRVAALLEQYGVTLLAGIGATIATQKTLFPQAQFFKTTEEFLHLHDDASLQAYAILVKGSRRFGFEQICQQLDRRLHRTVMEVNLSALENNLNWFRARLHKGVKLLVLVKAFAYGNGLGELAQLLQYHKVDYLGVAFADEGFALRQAGITLPILVLNPALDAFTAMLEYNLEPNIFSLELLHAFNEAAGVAGKKEYPIHLKLDTGMHRVGFMEGEIDVLLEELAHCTHLRVASIFSHLAGADEEALDAFTLSQLERFERMSSRILAALPYRPMRHILNSAGQERFPNWQYDMVRLGIGLHGISCCGNRELQPVASLKTFVAQIKELEVGETVGYGCHGKVPQRKRIATIPIGYADGYNRHLGNGTGKVGINGHLAPTIGNICMDTCMIDITGLEVKEGDSVTIFGSSPTLEDLATWLDTIPYEVLSSISPRIPRTYYSE